MTETQEITLRGDQFDEDWEITPEQEAYLLTLDAEDKQRCCDSRSPERGFFCTRPAGHDGHHQASYWDLFGDKGLHVLAIWD